MVSQKKNKKIDTVHIDQVRLNNTFVRGFIVFSLVNE